MWTNWVFFFLLKLVFVKLLSEISLFRDWIWSSSTNSVHEVTLDVCPLTPLYTRLALGPWSIIFFCFKLLHSHPSILMVLLSQPYDKVRFSPIQKCQIGSFHSWWYSSSIFFFKDRILYEIVPLSVCQLSSYSLFNGRNFWNLPDVASSGSVLLNAMDLLGGSYMNL